MSFELALKEVAPTFTSDDGVELQIRPIKSTDAKALLGFFKNLPAPELMFFKHRVTDPEITQAWCDNIVLDTNLPLLALDEGKVVAVGKGKVKEDGGIQPMDVKAGDTILFGKYSGQEIKLDGDDYLIMREDEVLGVVNTK